MIAPECVLPLLPGSYNIYFASLVLMDRYSGLRYITMLFESILDVCMELARLGVYFREICTNAFSPAGEALCNRLEFTHISNNIIHGKMYACQLSKLIYHPVISWLIGRGRADLRRLYAQSAPPAEPVV
jgi:hypothetical protein